RERIFAHYGPGFPAEPVRAMWGERFRALCDERLDLKPGAIELLDYLDRAGVPCAVATSSAPESVRRHFGRLGLTDRFRHVVAQGDYAKGKPSPDPYLAAAARLHVAPSVCLALEDSVAG